MSYFPKDDTYIFIIPMNATLSGSGGNYGKYTFSTIHHTVQPNDYWADSNGVSDYTDGAMDSEEVGSGTYIIPFASTLTEVHFQYEEREGSAGTDAFDVILAKCTEAHGTGPTSTLSEGYKFSVDNTTGEGNGYGHYHSVTGLSVSWAQDDLLMPMFQRTDNDPSGTIEPICLLTCVFKRTG